MTEDEKEAFGQDLELVADDYLRLPEYGHHWLNLCDAALLAALDNWACGAEPVPPFDDVHPGQTYDPKVREAVRPQATKILNALQRLIAAGELSAHVMQRTFPNADPVPERSYITLNDLSDCMEILGLESHGDVLNWIREEDDDDGSDIWRLSARVARRRAAWRLGLDYKNAPKFATSGNEPPNDDFKLKLEDQKVYIASLRKQIEQLDQKPLATRERTTLLNIIGGLVELIQTPKSGRNSEAAVIRELVTNYSDKMGISERNLQDKFAQAKRSLSQ